MEIKRIINSHRGRYEAQIEPVKFSAAEEEHLINHGEPLVDVGGSFSGTVSRPGQTDTTISFSGGDGSGAEAEPDIDPETGEILSITVTNGGSGYTSAPTVEINGDGSGASATAILDGDAVGSVTVDNGGSGYHEVPVSVSFSLPEKPVRLKSGFPVKEVFDMEDDPNADIKAKVWAEIVQSRMVVERDSLIQQTAYFEGTTIETL